MCGGVAGGSQCRRARALGTAGGPDQRGHWLAADLPSVRIIGGRLHHNQVARAISPAEACSPRSGRRSARRVAPGAPRPRGTTPLSCAVRRPGRSAAGLQPVQPLQAARAPRPAPGSPATTEPTWPWPAAVPGLTPTTRRRVRWLRGCASEGVGEAAEEVGAAGERRGAAGQPAWPPGRPSRCPAADGGWSPRPHTCP